MFRPRFAASLGRILRPAAPLSRIGVAGIARESRSRLLPRRLVGVQATRFFSISPSVQGRKDLFTKDQYEAIAEGTLDGILESMEILAEERADVDVEYSAGVLTITVPQGTYVINKQPPNRQIWLSSPVSGPRRFDWDHGRMIWIDARDETTLDQVMRKEIGIEYDITVPL